MKFTMQTEDLCAGVLSVIKALPARSTMSVLEGVLIEATNEGVHLVCSDLMFQKECTLPATVEEEGRCVLKGKFLADVLRKLPNEPLYAEQEGMILKIRSGRVRQRLQCIEFDEYPMMHAKGDAVDLSLRADQLRNMIDRTVFAVSQDDSRPVLTGTLIEANDTDLTFVATDSFQFALTNLKMDRPVAEKRTIVQGRVLSEISKMTEETEKDVTLSLTQTHLTVEVNDTKLTARLLDGNYIDYKRIIPKECKTRVLVNTQDLLTMTDRAQLIAKEGNNSVVMHFEGDTLTMNAESYVGRAEDTMEVSIVGDPIDIAFNPRYVINILKNITDETVYLEFNSPISPCVVRPVQGGGYLYLIVPMRVY
ncbi:MAG: DNA polymerase III subunit beta [Clostridia bacterium]|nr:DNA polymerase III subunit beta [Clostridia bacterium]